MALRLLPSNFDTCFFFIAEGKINATNFSYVKTVS